MTASSRFTPTPAFVAGLNVAARRAPFDEFAASRHVVRHFAGLVARETIEAARDEFRAKGYECESFCGNILDESAMDEAVNQCLERYGRIDILVNNAAAMRNNKAPEDTTLPEWEKVIHTNVDGAFIVLFFSVFSCLACVPWLVSGAVPMSGWQVAVLFAAGGGAALGQFGITWAYRFSEPRQIAVYDYAGIVFAAILGFAAFGQTPDATSLVGMLVIIGMGVALHLRFPRRLRAGL